MNINNPPHWIRAIYSGLKWKIQTDSKTLYLTFDDGPTPQVTEWVIDTLNKYNAKATFFCIGRNVDRHTDIYNKIIKNGHVTGNHTYSHLKGWKTPNKEYFEDIELASQNIDSLLFRPPYGKIKFSQIKKLRLKGYKLIMWDVLSEDYNNNITTQQCLNNVLQYASNGSIIVFHDSIKAQNNLYYALPKVLEYYSGKGYVFKSINL